MHYTDFKLKENSKSPQPTAKTNNLLGKHNPKCKLVIKCMLTRKFKILFVEQHQ